MHLLRPALSNTSADEALATGVPKSHILDSSGHVEEVLL